MTIKGLIGGLVGGFLGAAVWAAVVYFTEYEIGWIAIGVGFLAGVGVRFGSDETSDGMVSGIASAVIAAGAIVLAKFLSVYLMVGGVFGDNLVTIDDKVMIARYAIEIVENKESKGEKINWPPGHDLEDTPADQSYPQKIWNDASSRWNKISAEEKETKKTEAQDEINEVMDSLKSSVREEAFKESFGGMDILFFLIAAYTAFQTGSGASDD